MIPLWLSCRRRYRGMGLWVTDFSLFPDGQYILRLEMVRNRVVRKVVMQW